MTSARLGLLNIFGPQGERVHLRAHGTPAKAPADRRP